MEKRYIYLLSFVVISPVIIVFGVFYYKVINNKKDRKDQFLELIINKNIKGKVEDIKNIKERHNGLALIINNEQIGCPEIDCQDFIKIGDSISKEINSTEFKVYRNNHLIKIFNYNNLKFR